MQCDRVFGIAHALLCLVKTLLKLREITNRETLYNRMLDILRPKQVVVSSSDESDSALTKPQQQVGSGQSPTTRSGALSGAKNVE